MPAIKRTASLGRAIKAAGQAEAGMPSDERPTPSQLAAQLATDSGREQTDLGPKHGFNMPADFPPAEFWEREIRSSDLPSLLQTNEFIHVDFPFRVRLL